MEPIILTNTIEMLCTEVLIYKVIIKSVYKNVQYSPKGG